MEKCLTFAKASFQIPRRHEDIPYQAVKLVSYPGTSRTANCLMDSVTCTLVIHKKIFCNHQDKTKAAEKREAVSES